MSLFKQISLLFLIFITMTMISVFYLNFKTANEFIQNQLYSDARDTATSLGLSISMVENKDEAQVQIETMIKAIFDSGYYQSIVLKDPLDKTIYEQHNPNIVKSVPQWFLKLVVLEDAVGKSEIMDGWQMYATVYVHNHNGHAYYQLWGILKGLFIWFVLIISFLFITLHFLLKLVFRPVKIVQEQAEEILQNHFIITDKIPFTTELQGVTQAMNTSVHRIKEIFERESLVIKKFHLLLYQDQEFKIPNRKYLIATLKSYVDTNDYHSFGVFGIFSIENFEELKLHFGYHKFLAFVHELLNNMKQFDLQHNKNENIIGRMGGNDFGLLLPGVSSNEDFSSIGKTMMKHSVEIAKKHFNDEYTMVQLHMGVGAYHPKEDITLILTHIDHALMRAKMKPSFMYETFRIDETASNFRDYGKEELLSLIREALDNNHLEMVYQRCINVVTHETFHRELFARFQTKEGKMIPARYILPVAHSIKILDEIDYYLLHKVCIDAEKCVYNVSSPTLSSTSFMQELRKLHKSNTISDNMGFEISLNTVSSNLKDTEHFVEKIREMEFYFGIDDFTFGGNVDEILKRLRPNYIKINALYLLGFTPEQIMISMLNSLNNLASSIGTKIIVYNVESQEHQDLFTKLGISYMQGFHIHKPELL